MASPESNTLKTDWELLRERWIVENLDPERAKPYTFKNCANDNGVAHQTVRNRACSEGWRDELRDRQRRRSQSAIEEAQSRFATDEAEVRSKHAGMLSQVMSSMWDEIEASGGIDFAALTPKQQAEIFLLVLKGHREALGLPTITRVDHSLGGDETAREMQSRLRTFLNRMKKASEENGEGSEDESPEADGA